MSAFAYHRMIVGYHGCDRATVEAVILGGAKLRPSKNVWDWLGHGIYFWEHGPHRALEFARDQQKRGIVQTPAVLGAYIHLGNCFDLTDRLAMEALAQYFPVWKEAQPEGEPLFPGAGIRHKTHIQISVRDARCMLGYFVPAIHETEPEP